MTRLSSRRRALYDQRPIDKRRVSVRRIAAACTGVPLAVGAVPTQALDSFDTVNGTYETAAP